MIRPHLTTSALATWLFVVGVAPAARAQAVVPNVIDFGVRFTDFGDGSDQGRAQRYRDLRNGPTLDLFSYMKETEVRFFNVEADHVGYRDQHFAASLNDYGKFKTSFDWNQIPLFFSSDTQTLFTSTAPGVLRINDSIQTAAQTNPASLTVAAGQAQPFDLHLQRNIALFKATYSATQHLDLMVSVKNTTKNGNQPWAGTFGFSAAVDVPVPVDTRTTELGVAAEWANHRAAARIGYDGSFFRNNISTLTWDNPQRITDSATAGPLQGRMSLWPDSDMHTASLMGLINLPVHSRATAFLSVGSQSQNAALIPFTINSALPVIALDRATAEARARVTAMNYSFTSRPIDNVSFTARYSSYDFDNRTPVFHVTNTVAYDTTVEAFPDGGTTPYSTTRRTFDADLSLTPIKYTAFRVGYTREQVGETFRTYDTTTEDTVRLSADTSAVSWMTLRGVYEHATRVGTGLDEQALDDIGEQVSLRQFDISDRTSNRFSGIVMITPVSQVSLNATASVGNDARPGTVFGLVSDDSRGYSVGMDFVPRAAVSLGLNYEYERYTTLQASREANPGVQFDDPTRDWTTSGNDKAQTFTAALDLIKAWPKTDVRMAYNNSHADSLYLYGLPANTTLPPVVQLPTVTNRLQRGTVDVRYHLTPHVGIGLVYWYDAYAVNNFAQNPSVLTSIAQPSFLMIGDLDRPYTASTFSGRLTYAW